ncbi:uncharacterized protein LOC123210670 isoform X2 [Mangifera indica]|uniref:uncharacterized protein LOC123210670 isoform X2 n=1 Tax=Mangifera indica TaxID=29780 RepID=UPI001CFBFA4D|nr:uncharacterized protein LOC123210670 isoform X2 [Mangifera indica]
MCKVSIHKTDITRVSKTYVQNNKKMEKAPDNLKMPDPILVSPAPPLHQSDADEDDENVKQLQECSSIYLSLQTCLINNNRNWKSCQMEVQALKACNQKRMKDDKRK